VFLLLGAIVNVAVAWGCEMWCPSVDMVNVGVRFYPLPAGERWYRSAPVHWPPPAERGHVNLVGRTATWTSITRERQGLAPSDVFHFSQLVIECGWPLRSLEYEHQVNQRPYSIAIEKLADFGEVPAWLRPIDERRRLPLRPIWPGFAINTLFYAAILWLLFAAPFALRRRRRIKRGLCPKCAYPVGDSAVCTEWGAPHTVRVLDAA
jgi:hypothetical protein